MSHRKEHRGKREQNEKTMGRNPVFHSKRPDRISALEPNLGKFKDKSKQKGNLGSTLSISTPSLSSTGTHSTSLPDRSATKGLPQPSTKPKTKLFKRTEAPTSKISTNAYSKQTKIQLKPFSPLKIQRRPAKQAKTIRSLVIPKAVKQTQTQPVRQKQNKKQVKRVQHEQHDASESSESQNQPVKINEKLQKLQQIQDDNADEPDENSKSKRPFHIWEYVVVDKRYVPTGVLVLGFNDKKAATAACKLGYQSFVLIEFLNQDTPQWKLQSTSKRVHLYFYIARVIPVKVKVSFVNKKDDSKQKSGGLKKTFEKKCDRIIKKWHAFKCRATQLLDVLLRYRVPIDTSDSLDSFE